MTEEKVNYRPRGPAALSSEQMEDAWSWVEIGEPFPEGPVRVKGEQNQYVALWYKHGKPVQGRAWNNNGVVECSFPYNKVELTGKKDLGGKIQILSYESWRDQYDTWKECGFTYRWVPWAERRAEHLQSVRCGDSTVVLIKAPDGNVYSGNIDFTSETAQCSFGGKTHTLTTGIDKLLTIVRDLRDPRPEEPAEPPKKEDPPPPPPPEEIEHFDVWGDVREGDDMSRCRYPVMALGRPLKVGGAEGTKEMLVALWYKHGKPVCGAVYNNGGKIGAEFVSHGEAHTNKVGSLQVLTYCARTAGFKLDWRPYKEAMAKGSGWWAVRVNNTAPCVVIRPDGTERLGRVELSKEGARCVGVDGKPCEVDGPKVGEMLVLCRDSPVPGAHYPEDKD